MTVDTVRKKLLEVLRHYSEVSSIAGLGYISKRHQSLAGKLFWSVVILGLALLGTYWSYQVYIEWESKPVIFAVNSTAVPISEVPFPSLFFCNEGKPEIIFTAGFYRTLLERMSDKNETLISPPITLAKQKLNVIDEEVSAADLATLAGRKFAEVFNDTLRGYNITENSTISDFISLFDLFYQYDMESYEKLSFLFETSNKMIGTKTVPMFLYYFSTELLAMALVFGQHWYKPTSMSQIDFSTVFETVISHLWYSRLPCFDIMNLTSTTENEVAFIKNCKWKGRPISCAAIFTSFPTDQGLCCAFNIDAADSTFAGDVYSNVIKTMQAKDKQMSISNVTIPDWYDGEPVSRAGMKYSLQVTLDAHLDLFRGKSFYRTNYEGFTFSVTPKNEFPIISERSIKIKRGFRTQISLSSTIMSSDDSIRLIDVKKRNCSFEDESSLILFRTYTKTNCIFECTLRNAQKLTAKNNRTCTPWFLPFIDDEQRTCDPFEAKPVLDYMNKKQGVKKCDDHCLADCNYFAYKSSVSTEPFQSCNDINVGISNICKIRNRGHDSIPMAWGYQVALQLRESCQLEKKFQSNISSSTRSAQYDDAFGLRQPYWNEYDAFAKDISVVNVYFGTTTAWRVLYTSSSSWTIYFSSVGGLYGLCFGLCIATVIELNWLCLQLFGVLSQALFKIFIIFGTRKMKQNNKHSKKCEKNAPTLQLTKCPAPKRSSKTWEAFSSRIRLLFHKMTTKKEVKK